MPGDGGLFRKNDLDEMTVRRTEKPVDGAKPARIDAGDAAPCAASATGVGSYEDPGERTARADGRARQGGPGGRPNPGGGRQLIR